VFFHKCSSLRDKRLMRCRSCRKCQDGGSWSNPRDRRCFRMATVESNKKKSSKEGKKEMNRLDIYTIFLFATQVYIYYSEVLSNNFSISNLVKFNGNLSVFVFILFCLTFFILFANLFYLFLAYKSKDSNESNLYISTVFIGTVLFFVLNFVTKILFLKLDKSSLF
jgi:hypothetical protein